MLLMRVIKKIDDLGRVAIPKDIRKAMGLFSGDEIELLFQEEEKQLIIKPYVSNYAKQITKLKEEIAAARSEAGLTGVEDVLDLLAQAEGKLTSIESDLQK